MKTNLKIGILGGGQLARMLCLKGHELGYAMHVLSGAPSDPAALVTAHHQRGPVDSFAAVKKFAQSVDVLTFESEFIDVELLGRLPARERAKIRPRVALLGQLQERTAQKTLLVKHGLPTLPFLSTASVAELKDFWLKHNGRVVAKKTRFGYDGYGTFYIESEKELVRFVASESLANFIFEPKVKFKRELAVTVVRGLKGEMIELPLVETKQVNSRCFWVKGPIKHKKLSRLSSQLRRFLQREKYVGAISFELFEISDELYINEVAPRVHNSAHYSLNALSLDQFSAHLLAVSGAQLFKPLAKSGGFAMVNLLGRSKREPGLVAPRSAQLHWYGKSENRPGRKMGHLNTTAQTPEKALALALQDERKFQL